MDDHPLVRQGLALVLQQGGFAVSGEADGIQTTLCHPALASAQVVVLDLMLEGASGLDLIPAVCRRGIRVVVYSMHEDPAMIRRALAAGATGYVTAAGVPYEIGHGFVVRYVCLDLFGFIASSARPRTVVYKLKH